jgi:sugar phosphate permease
LNAYRRWAIYLIACTLFIFSQFYRSSIAVISPNLIEDLDLDIRNLGVISSAFFYAFAMMQIPVGIYLDTVGPRAIMTCLSLLAAGGAVIFACGQSSGDLIIGRLLLGMGMACNLMGPLKLMTAWFSPYRFATLSTVFFSLGAVGNIAAATPLVWMTSLLGWRTTFLVLAAINLLIVILFFFITRDRPEKGPEHPSLPTLSFNFEPAWHVLRQLITNRDYWLISLATFCRYGIYAAIQALWAAPFLMTTMGISQVMTGHLLLAMNLGLIVGSPGWGWMSDSLFHSRRSLIVTGLGVMALILVLMAVFPANTKLPILFALFFGFGFFSGAGQMMYAHIKELMPLTSAGAAMTGINFFTMSGVAFFLHGLGNSLKWFYPQVPVPPDAFRFAFLFFCICLTAIALLYSRTTDTSNRASGNRI